MSFSFNLLDDGSDGELQADGRVVRSYWQKYLYKDSAGSRPTSLTIAGNIGILPGSPFVDDTFATCHAFHLEHPEKSRPPKYFCHVTYKWSTAAVLNASTDTNPATRRTIWSVKPQIQQRFVTHYPNPDAGSGDPEQTLIVNTAGQPFDGGLPVDVRLGTAIATRNVDATGYNRNVVMAYSGAVNEHTYLGGAPGTVQVDVETVERFEGAYHYYAETWSFTYDKAKHQPSPLSAGFFERPSDSGSGGDLIRIQIDEKDILEPEPLDEFGFVVPVEDRPDGCFFVEVPYFPEIDFAIFGL